MKKIYLIITSFTLMLFSLASFINQHYLLAFISFVLANFISIILIIIENNKITFDLLDLSIMLIQLALVGLFYRQLKEISTSHIYITLLVALFNLLYHKAIITLNIKQQRYSYIISILILVSVFSLVAIADLIIILLFSLEGLLIYNYLIFIFIISFPTLLLGFRYVFHYQLVKA